MYIDPSGNQPKLVELYMSFVKSTPSYASMVYTMQQGLFQTPFYVAGFNRNLDVHNDYVYTARQDCWQRIGGYNVIYDFIFDTYTSMNSTRFQFNSEGTDYMLWAWKGDYLNLGAGAEMGLYSRMTIGVLNTPHWLVDDKSLAVFTSLLLKDDKGNTIADYNPSAKEWWITSFNPSYQNIKANTLTATFTMDFTGKDSLYNAFIKSKDYLDNIKNWSISENNKYLMTFEFK